MNVRIDGAWGLRFPSLVGADHILLDAPDWMPTELELISLPEPSTDTSSGWTQTGSHVPLSAGGYLRTVWPDEIELSLVGSPIPECVVQPHLTSAAASIQMRRGFQPFHAGAFAFDGRAWAVLGTREAGKSSSLALAASLGADIITDDLLVIADGAAFAGPRCIDLRPEAAAKLGIGKPLGVVGLRERWRVYVEPCSLSTEIEGFVVPSWGPDTLELMPPVSRFQELFLHSAMQGVTMNDPDKYLHLASLPMYAWTRPKSWATARTSFDRLVELLAG